MSSSASEEYPARPVIRSNRIVDDVAAYLRNLILDHKISPGTVLLQTEWADRLGVSRTPLREAFRILESHGLVRTSNGNRTVEVVQYTGDELHDLYQIREFIDGLAARLLATNGLTDEVDGQLRNLLADMDGASEPFRSSAWFAAHNAFHVLIATSCGNQQLRPLLTIIRSTTLALHSPMVEQPARDDLAHILRVSHDQHHAIYEAIRTGNGAAAERVARKHISSTIRSDLIRRATTRADESDADDPGYVRSPG